MVERHLAKVEVAGSSPVIRSKEIAPKIGCFFISLGGGGVHPPRASQKLCRFSPVHFCVEKSRLDTLSSFFLATWDIASRKTILNRFSLAHPVIQKVINEKYSYKSTITGQCSGKPSHFALKTLLKRFLHERHNPLQRNSTQNGCFFISAHSLRQKQHSVVFACSPRNQTQKQTIIFISKNI